MKLTRTKIITITQVNISMMVTCAENYDYIGQVCNECQAVANSYNLPVVLLGKEGGDRHEFLPDNRDSGANINSQQIQLIKDIFSGTTVEEVREMTGAQQKKCVEFCKLINSL